MHGVSAEWLGHPPLHRHRRFDADAPQIRHGTVRAALQDHCDLLRAAFDRHSGYEVNYEGDAFFIAFATPFDAVAGAEEAQQALSAHAWPDDAELRVRMGIHTGTPLLAPPKYVGLDVHRAARIAASGHGGQVLVSAATVAALEQGRFAFRDLGEHRFKDLSAPERVYQLGDGDFSALNALYRTNLPIPATSFIGRGQELAGVVELLGRDEVRLLTLTGPGGTGKTRLAAQAAGEAAGRFPDGVWWVDLTSLRDPALVLATIAQTLGLKDASGADPTETVTVFIARKRALYVLDNAERLLPALASVLSPVVRDTESARFLVTSREPLRISSEHVRPVPALTPADSAELFVARATAAGSNVARSAVVDELCARLGQLPLALELAAARTTLLAPRELLDRLSQRLDLLEAVRDADPRQKTLRATIGWSYDLLTADEQEHFAYMPRMPLRRRSPRAHVLAS
jgi:NB-ARC domain/Adenylate and Guanylate cyclase catalytic domain